MKPFINILFAILLVISSCTSRFNKTELPVKAIDLILQDSDIDPESETGKAYLNGSVLPFIRSTMFDSSVVFIVSDSSGNLSGASGITHWIIIQHDSGFALLKTVYGANFHFQKSTDNSYDDIIFDYEVLGGPSPEYRRSSFTWNGSNYWLKDILIINGASNNIPVQMLSAINYRFTNFELEIPPDPAENLIIDSLALERCSRNQSADSLYILSYHSPLDEYTSWLFQDTPTGYIVLQKADDRLLCNENSTITIHPR